MSIRLVRAALQRDLRTPELWNGAAFFAEVENLGYAKSVAVRVEPDLEIECSFLTTHEEGREIWAGYWSDFGFFPARHPDLRFSLRYRVAGKTFADPPAAGVEASYGLNETQPCAVGAGEVALGGHRARRFADAATYEAFAAGREPLERLPLPPAAVFPAVLTWGWVDERVPGTEEVVVRSTLGGAPSEGITVSTRAPDERWFFVHHVAGTPATIELAVGCRAAGREPVWDDNFGKGHFLLVENEDAKEDG